MTRYSLKFPRRQALAGQLVFIARPVLAGLLLLAWLAATLATPFSVRANEFAAQIAGPKMTVYAGFERTCTHGKWMPVRVVLENQGADLEARIDVEVSGTESPTLYSRQISLPGVSRKETYLYIFAHSSVNWIKVRLKDGNKVLAETEERLNCPAGNLLIGVWAADLAAFGALKGTQANVPIHTLHLDAADIPDRGYGLDSLNILLISGVDTGVLSEAQRQALSDWVTGGGQLIVTGGPGWQKTSAGLADLLPVQPSGTQTLPDLQPLQAWAALPWGEEPGIDGSAVVTLSRLTSGARTLVDSSATPLIATRAQGSGQVAWIAVDPALDPLRGWAGWAKVYDKLRNSAPARTPWGQGVLSWYSASQAISSIPGLGLLPAGVVMAFLCIYTLAIGPLNLLVLRLLKRRELGWITVPGIVLFFTALAFISGNRLLGNRAVLSQVALVQVWPGASQARVDGFLGIFSPSRTNLSIDIDPRLAASPVIGQPQLDAQGGWHFAADEQATNHLPDLNMDVAELVGVGYNGYVPAPQIHSNLTLTTQAQGLTLQGTLTNASDLELQDAVLLVPGGKRNLGDLSPGETVDVQMFIDRMGQATGIPGSTSNSPTSYGYTYGYPSSALIQDFLGTSDPYTDLKFSRRSGLLMAMTDFGNTNNTGHGAGIYLAGWSSQAPFENRTANGRGKTDSDILYLVSLTPKLAAGANQGSASRIILPPSMFTWSENSTYWSSANSPYELYMNQQEYVFNFRLAFPLEYQSVEALTLHLQGYNSSGPAGIDVYLWDFESEGWSLLPSVEFGDSLIESSEAPAARFVGPGSEIRLRLDNSQGTNSYLYLERADFSLVVQP